jgi:hypothetical protein
MADPKRQAEAERAGAKATLLAAVVSTDMGRACDSARLSAVETAVRQLETLNSTLAPTRSTLLNGRWSAAGLYAHDACHVTPRFLDHHLLSYISVDDGLSTRCLPRHSPHCRP